jgi:hypothetical protein
MAIFRVSATARAVSARGNGMQHRIAVGLAIAFVALLAIPLGAATISLTEDRLETGEATDAAKAWAEPAGWRVIAVEVDNEGIVISAAGALPAPPAEELRAALDAEGLEGEDVRLELVPLEMVELPGR